MTTDVTPEAALPPDSAIRAAFVKANDEFGHLHHWNATSPGVLAFARSVIALDRAARALTPAPVEAALPVGFICERTALVKLRDRLDELSLHTHKRKVVRDWIDEAIAETEAQARAAVADTAPERCDHGIRRPHECHECAEAALAATPTAPAPVEEIPAGILHVEEHTGELGTQFRRYEPIRMLPAGEYKLYLAATAPARAEAVIDEELCKGLSALGWQKVVCGMCGSDNARGYPRATAPALTRGEPAGWRSALKFYADRCHFNIADEDAWDTVSGEPSNFWCDEAGTATMEDGTVAAMALAGTPLPDEDAESPAPQGTEP